MLPVELLLLLLLLFIFIFPEEVDNEVAVETGGSFWSTAETTELVACSTGVPAVPAAAAAAAPPSRSMTSLSGASQSSVSEELSSGSQDFAAQTTAFVDRGGARTAPPQLAADAVVEEEL